MRICAFLLSFLSLSIYATELKKTGHCDVYAGGLFIMWQEISGSFPVSFVTEEPNEFNFFNKKRNLLLHVQKATYDNHWYVIGDKNPATDLEYYVKLYSLMSGEQKLLLETSIRNEHENDLEQAASSHFSITVPYKELLLNVRCNVEVASK